MADDSDGTRIAAYQVGTVSPDELQKAINQAWARIKKNPDELAFMANELQTDVASLKALDEPPFVVKKGPGGLFGLGVGEALLIFLGKVAAGVAVKLAVDVLTPHARRVWDSLFVEKVKQETEGSAFGKDADRDK